MDWYFTFLLLFCFLTFKEIKLYLHLPKPNHTHTEVAVACVSAQVYNPRPFCVGGALVGMKKGKEGGRLKKQHKCQHLTREHSSLAL